MQVVGLTGNIGAGKSTVARLLAARGATVVDSDVLARDVVRPGTPAHRAIVERWGAAVIAPDGELDRAALRQRVFADPDELEALNRIVHPEVMRLRHALIAEARRRGERVVVCDVPLLFESNLADEFDLIILVDAPRPVRLERLVRERGLREPEAMDMITAQMPAELKRARADVVIDNDGDLAALERNVAAAWQAIERRARRSADEGAGAVSSSPALRRAPSERDVP
jgi:dephospho-CoA kinase